MNRTTFLFLVLLIGSCLVTVNSRHNARTLLSEKAVLREEIAGLQETIRRIELENARLVTKEASASAKPISAPAAARP